MQELGFPKLKNFINTLSDIQIELAGTNNSFAKLKSSKKALKKINADENNFNTFFFDSNLWKTL